MRNGDVPSIRLQLTNKDYKGELIEDTQDIRILEQ